MDTLVGIIHVITALVLISLVLLQDSKGDGVGGAFGGGTSNSVLGATGATTLAQKMTRWAAIVFAVTSISLTALSRKPKSVVENLPAAPAAPAATAPAPTDAAATPADAAASTTTTVSTTTTSTVKK